MHRTRVSGHGPNALHLQRGVGLARATVSLPAIGGLAAPGFIVNEVAKIIFSVVDRPKGQLCNPCTHLTPAAVRTLAGKQNERWVGCDYATSTLGNLCGYSEEAKQGIQDF